MSLPSPPDGRHSSLARTAALFCSRPCPLLSTGDPFPEGLLSPKIPALAEEPQGLAGQLLPEEHVPCRSQAFGCSLAAVAENKLKCLFVLALTL